MAKFFPMEIRTISRVYNVCKGHEKFFFILHQGTLDESFSWEGNKIIVKHYDYKIGYSFEEDSRSFINHSKFFLFLYDGLNDVISNKLKNEFIVSGDYEIIKTNSRTDFSIDPEMALIYLPQTNQMLIYSIHDSFDRDIFITHEYVVIIPISAPLKHRDLSLIL